MSVEQHHAVEGSLSNILIDSKEGYYDTSRRFIVTEDTGGYLLT